MYLFCHKTTLKYVILRVIALSLIYVPTLEATTFTVTNSANAGAATLRSAITQINSPASQYDAIDFSPAITRINLTSALPALRKSITVTGRANLKIQSNAPENLIFVVGGSNVNLHLIGNNNLDGTGNWSGGIQGIGTGASVTLEQQLGARATYPGQISGSINVTFQGPTAIALSNTSTYSGTTAISATTVQTLINNALPTGTLVNITRVGATSGDLQIGNGLTQTLGGLTGSNSFVDMGNNSVLEISSNTDSNFGGIIRGGGTLIKDGTGNFTLTNSNQCETVNILGGTLTIGATNAVPQTSVFTVSDNATLAISQNQTLQSISGNGQITIDDTMALTVQTVADIGFPGNITTNGSGTFVKSGTNMLTLSGANAGNLELVDAPGGVKIPIGGVWDGPVTIGAATLEMNGGTVTQAITGNGFDTSTLNVTNIFTPRAAITDVGSINVDAGDNFTINPGFEPTGFLNFNVNLGGTVDLNTNFTIPLAATLTNAGTFSMNNFNLLMENNSILNSGTLSTSGSIASVGGAGYALNVQTNETFTVNNPVTGYTGLIVADGGEVILNNGGNLSNGITLGNSIFTFNGGSYSGNVAGVAGSVMDINNTLTAPGAITVDTLNINAGGVFTPSVNVITNAGLNVRQNGTLLLTNDLGTIGAMVDNAGTITHTENATRVIRGNFTQEQTGILNIGVSNAAQYSQIRVNGNTTLNGGVLNVQVLSGAQITNGTVFDIIDANGGIVGGAVLPTVPKASLFFRFTPVITGNRLQLIASRSGCMCINTIPPLQGIAKGVDDLTGNHQFTPLLDVLNQQTSQKAFENKLEQLAPTGLNGIHTVMAHGLGGTEQILLRLDTLRTAGTAGALARTGYIKTGYAAGDAVEDRGSYGPMVFGNSTKQSSIGGLSGYKATTAGIGFLGDAPILEHFRVGLGASYATSMVRQFNNTGSYIKIGSTQGMAYSSATYGRLFLDGVLSAGINNYHGNRSINFIGPTATSRYNGFQYGAKVKTGFGIPCHQVEISPMAAVQYMHLKLGQYTEQGAGILNQHVSSMQTSTVRVNLGGKIAKNGQEGILFPEMHAFYINDFKNPPVVISSRFIEGGGSFTSTSVVSPREGINVGASITALVSDDFALSGGYDLEAKKSFRSHSASLKFKFLF